MVKIRQPGNIGLKRLRSVSGFPERNFSEMISNCLLMLFTPQLAITTAHVSVSPGYDTGHIDMSHLAMI